MRSGDTFLARGSKVVAFVLVCGMQLAIVGFSLVVHAVGTPIQTTVDQGDIHPALTLDSIVSPLTVTVMPLNLSGSLESLTQIQVYVDNVFSVTIPVSEGATSFAANLVIPAGTHTVKLVGISPFADTSPTITISVTYMPPSGTEESQTTTSSPGGGQNTPAATDEKWGGVIVSPDATPATTLYAPPSQRASALPPWLYSGLVAVDIARPGDTDGQIVAMLQRAALLVPALFLLIFARPALYALYFIRFKWFGLRTCQLPKRVGHPPSLHLRVIGVLLMLGVFSFS